MSKESALMDPVMVLPTRVSRQNVFNFLTAVELAKSQRVSKKWNFLINDQFLWQSVLTMEEKKKLNEKIYHAIEANNSELVLGLCQKGADLNLLLDDIIEIKTSHPKKIKGSFSRPTLLHIAANRCCDQAGMQIVKTLLKYGARVETLCYISVEKKGCYFYPTVVVEKLCNSLENANELQVRSILMIANFEAVWAAGNLGQEHFLFLKEWVDCDKRILRDYCQNLCKAEKKFVGYTAEFNQEKISMLKVNSKMQQVIEELAAMSVSQCNIL